jgi:hypothetical protein
VVIHCLALVLEQPINRVRRRRNFVEPAANGEELDQARQDAAFGLQQVGVGLCIHVFRRVGEAGFAAQPTIANVG